jgi:hypothetical protein
LWSLHPKYLDAKGLVALWREGLLAKKVLEGQTRGYRNHPQLTRFKECKDPLKAINIYLHLVCDEADHRGYEFDRTNLAPRKPAKNSLAVNTGQVEFEWKHLLNKLKARSPENYKAIKADETPMVHPIFKQVAGGVEPWEIV